MQLGEIVCRSSGQVALTNVLAKINRRQAQGPAPATGSTSDKDLDREYDIVKCLKALMNNKYGADDALAHQQVIVSLASSLISPRLTTRKLVSEVLTFLCHWAEGEGHLKVLQAMDYVKSQQGENGRFDAWMRIVEVTIDGRGKMGSLVGASEEVRSGGIGMENLLMGMLWPRCFVEHDHRRAREGPATAMPYSSSIHIMWHQADLDQNGGLPVRDHRQTDRAIQGE
jgi:hypothetical protein